MTVPHSTGSGWERERQRRALIEEAVQAPDLATFTALVASVDARDWLDVQPALSLRLGAPIVPEPVAHRHAKLAALRAESERRRRAAIPSTE